MRFKINITPNAKKYRESVDARVKKAKSAVGRKLSEKIRDEVLRRIPPGGGWLKIYRDAMTFVEEDGTWKVLAEADVELTQVPADKSLVYFDGSSTVAAVLKSFNPWPVDTIPAISGGISATVSVLAASEAEVMEFRSRKLTQASSIDAALNSIGVTVKPYDRPVINGSVTADLRFLSRRLEFGLAGYPRVPHWTPAAAEARRSGETWIAQDQRAKDEIREAFEVNDE